MKSDKISSKELFGALDQIYEEKGITREYLMESLREALKNAYKRDFINTYCLDEREESKNTKNEELIGEEKKETKNGYLIPQDIDIDFSESSIKVYCVKEVVEKVSEKEKGVKISLEDAKAISKRAKVGDMIKVEVTPKNFGRIAASNAKNIIIQKINEAEKNLVYTQYADKVGQIIVGTVQKTEKYGVIVDLGRVEALIPVTEQIKTDAKTTFNNAKESIRNVNFKEDAKITSGYVSGMIKNPLETLKKIAADRKNSNFKNALILVFLWLHIIFYNTLL